MRNKNSVHVDNSEEWLIMKTSGEIVPFDERKLKGSLNRAGASDRDIDRIVSRVKAKAYAGMSTKEVYNIAFKILRSLSESTASRYKLKKAILELGPTGFPFEKFIGALLRHEQFNVQIGVKVAGQCVDHEVDVVANKGDSWLMVECKFHSDQARYCDVKIPLYIASRFRDIREAQHSDRKGRSNFSGWIMTNTRFTSDAERYGQCAGLTLIGWDYPAEGSLRERIDAAGLHPITSLSTLTKDEKQELLSKEKVLCKDILKNPEILNSIGVSQKRSKNILHELADLCEPLHIQADK